jgi:hypothetical protein
MNRELLVAALVVVTGWNVAWSQEPRAGAFEAASKFRGKAGLYLRLDEVERKWRTEFYLRHPLVDALIVTYTWADLEPSPEHFDFSEVDRVLELCRKFHKGFVLGIAAYGQNPKQPLTPEWVYDVKGVKRIFFAGGGVAKGAKVCVPRPWDEVFVQEYGKLIRKAGDRYNGKPGIWFVEAGLGHIAELTAQPSSGGGPAFLAEGFTPAIWKTYCHQIAQSYQDAFPDTPLIVKASNMLVRDRAHRHYCDAADEILAELAQRHISIITFGLEPTMEGIRENDLPQRYARLSSFSRSGQIRFGAGDDWPLWVPPERRTARFIAGRDEKGLAKEIQYAFGDMEGLPKSYISLMFVLHPEMSACHPEQGAAQNKEIFQLFTAARQRLIQEDPIITGTH